MSLELLMREKLDNGIKWHLWKLNVIAIQFVGWRVSFSGAFWLNLLFLNQVGLRYQ